MVGTRFFGHHQPMLKLLILDDSELIRTRLVDWLQNIPGLKPIETAGTLAQALSVVTDSPPAMAILDLNLPDGKAIEILPALRQLAPDMQIAMLTNEATDYNRTKCLEAGAHWFFDKSTEFEKVLDLVQAKAALH